MAEMKFGTDRENLIQYDYHKLGAAVVTFDLLKTKLINVIDFDKLCEQKSIIKGAAFILYNVARLQKLLYTFDTQVSSGYYKPLPELDQIDFGLLREEVCIFEIFRNFFVNKKFCLFHCDHRKNGKCSMYT